MDETNDSTEWIDSDVDCENSPFYITRVSAQVYLELSDFERLGNLVLQLLGKCKDKSAKVDLKVA
jgi:hypothetical protein